MDEQITIKSGDLQAVISCKGAEAQSLKKGEREYIWQGDSKFWSGRAPLLFPICGGLKDDKYTFNGIDYTQLKHGFAKKRIFEVLYKKENEVAFLLTEDEETLKGFPFKFRLIVKYILTDELRVEYSVENCDEKAMYFCIGAHEGYALCERFEDYSIEFEQKEELNSYVLNGNLLEHRYINAGKNTDELKLKYDYFAVDALVFKDIKSRKVFLKYKDNRIAEVEFSDFNHLLLWTKPNAGYICIEPWTAVPDFVDSNGQISEKPNITRLESGKKSIFNHTIKIL